MIGVRGFILPGGVAGFAGEVGATERDTVRPFEPARLPHHQTLRHQGRSAGLAPRLVSRGVSGYRGRRVELAGVARSRFGTTGAREISDSSALGSSTSLDP